MISVISNGPFEMAYTWKNFDSIIGDIRLSDTRLDDIWRRNPASKIRNMSPTSNRQFNDAIYITETTFLSKIWSHRNSYRLLERTQIGSFLLATQNLLCEKLFESTRNLFWALIPFHISKNDWDSTINISNSRVIFWL